MSRSVVVLAWIALAACGSADGDDGRFRAVFIADTHIASPEYVCCTESNANDNDSIVKSADRLRRVVASINAIRPRPDLVFLLGDALHDPYHSTDRAHYDAGTAFQQLHDILGALEVPIHIAWGNHDYAIDCSPGAYVSRAFSHGLFRDLLATEPYHAVDWKGWRFVLGNSELGPTWDPGTPTCDTEQGSYGAAQLAWIDDQLGGGLPATFMAHYSFFVTATGEDPTGPNPDLVTVLDRHTDNLQLTLAGHTHLWLDFASYAVPHHIIGSTRYDADNFMVVEFDPRNRSYRLLDHDKGRRTSTCADTWQYDGDPAALAVQPDEDGSCE